jgi:hypothetical protein
MTNMNSILKQKTHSQIVSLVAATIMCLCVMAPAIGQDAANEDQLEFFEQHIRPLLVSRCYSCHSSRAQDIEGGLTLDRRSGWAAGGDSGPAIIPGDVDASLLIRSVRYDDPNLQMPPDRRLSRDAIAKLERWVQMGAADPRDDASAETQGTVSNAADPIAGREHWAYRPLAKVTMPTVTNHAWPRGVIDTFVLSKLEQNSLTPAPDAERRTLARRVYIQLIGMPPTSEQMAEFLADERTDAVELLVDRLLSSPHFGERWGRHWHDLARYADSNGLDENFLFREAWRYRNRVIDMVNDDMPYDRFLLEQIAGDLLPYDSIEQRDQQRISAGFLLVGPKVLLDIDRDVQRMDVADEQLDTIGKAILGQTIGCARCHDHKFDPIPTADYYAMAGILTSTQVMEKRHMLNEQRVMERLVGLGANGDQIDEEYETFWREKKQLEEQRKRIESSVKLIKEGEYTALLKLVKNHPDEISEIARDHCADLADRIQGQQMLLDQVKTRLANPPAIPPRAMIPSEADEIGDEAIRLAGQADRKGDRVPRGFLQVLTSDPSPIPEQASGRLELAQWLTREENGAGHLTARVMANRIWHHLVGRGLVRTVDNFGRRGEAPSHPELLDFLARELIDSGWSVKSLVRKIVLSRTFAMSSEHCQSGHAIDPDNQLLWRAHRRRLAPETMRDGMLLAAGTLDLSPMDSTVWYLGDQATSVGANKNRRRTDFLCRSVYLPVIRNDLPELFDVFDFANPQATTGMRGDTMVPTQGLFMMNDISVMAASKQTAKRLLDEPCDNDPARVDRMFELIIQSPATDDDRNAILAFIQRQLVGSTGNRNEADRVQAWSLACQAVYGSSRFQIVE